MTARRPTRRSLAAHRPLEGHDQLRLERALAREGGRSGPARREYEQRRPGLVAEMRAHAAMPRRFTSAAASLVAVADRDAAVRAEAQAVFDVLADRRRDALARWGLAPARAERGGGAR